MYNNHTQASAGTDIASVDGWLQFIAKGRSKTSRKVANNTTVRALNDSMVAIKLHDTDIVIVTPNTYTLNTGGWQTVTTKERINRFSPARISQRAGIWYMSDGSLFYDGMVIDRNGKPRKPRTPKATAKYEAKLKQIKKQAKAYAKGFVAALQDGAIDFPSAGDCWGCYFALSSSTRIPESSQNIQQPFGTSHLLDHMEESYFVPSLLVNAAHDSGWRDDQIGMMGIGKQRVFIDPERFIYKYVVKQLQKEL